MDVISAALADALQRAAAAGEWAIVETLAAELGARRAAAAPPAADVLSLDVERKRRGR